jgi:hypothetical protein
MKVAALDRPLSAERRGQAGEDYRFAGKERA